MSGSEEMKFSVREDVAARVQNAICELENRLLLSENQKREERNAIRDLTADISHQLKTPLASLRLFCEMDEGRHMSEQLSQIERMEGLIQSLLRLERLSADGYEFVFEEHDISELVNDAWKTLKSVYPEKKMILSGSAVIRCDKKWMGEALTNLLKNACEHTPLDGEIRAFMDKSENAVFLSIQDNGGGVEKKELIHLFDRFYRAQSRKSSGVGIGLSIVKEIVRCHHGSVYAENIPGGLKINITLPVLQLIRT